MMKLEAPLPTGAESGRAVAGVTRLPRWPSPSAIRQTRAALERGDSLALAGRQLQFCTSFFGLALPAVPAGLSARQWAARQNWVRRREAFGPTGFSAPGLHAMRLNLVNASIRKAREPKARACGRGHTWTRETTRLTRRGRSCRVCEKLLRDQRRWRRGRLPALRREFARARDAMIRAGVRAHRAPESAYWRARAVATRQRFRDLRTAVRALERHDARRLQPAC